MFLNCMLVSDACKDICKTQRYRNHQNNIKTTVIQPEMGGFSLALAHDVNLSSSPLSTCRVGDVSMTSRQPAFSSLGGSIPESHEYNQQRHQLIVTSASPLSAGVANTAATSVDENMYYSVSDNALTEHLLPVSQRGDDKTSPLIPSSFSATLRSARQSHRCDRVVAATARPVSDPRSPCKLRSSDRAPACVNLHRRP